MAEDESFHYVGILDELSYALRHGLQAHDWKDNPAAAPAVRGADRQIQERGNVRLALTHCRNAYVALKTREADLTADLSIMEADMTRQVERDIRALDPGQPATSLPAPESETL